MSGAAAASASSGPTTFAPQTEVFAVTGSAAAPSPSRTADTLASQLARPVLSVATSAPGTHELTVRVTPEHLGPVSVRAIVSPDGVRIELLAPGEAGREALRQVLGDLRRDLITAGLTATLDVSPRDAGTGTGAGTGPGSDPRFGHEPATGDQPATRDPRHPSDRSSDHPSDSTPGTESQPAMNGGAAASTLDVIA